MTLQELVDELDKVGTHLQLAYDCCQELHNHPESTTTAIIAIQSAKAIRKAAEALGLELEGPPKVTGLSAFSLGEDDSHED